MAEPELIWIPPICTTKATEATSIPYVHITIGDKGIVALWDSGASISYVSRSAANHLAVLLKPGRIRNAKTANGSSFQFLGSFSSPVRIAGILVEHTFLVAEDHCCPGNALLGVDFMSTLDRQGVMTVLRPSCQKLLVGDREIDIIGPSKKAYELTNAVMEMICAEKLVLKPGKEYMMKIANGSDMEADEAVLLKSIPGGNLLFEKTIFHPLESRETEIRVRNMSKEIICINEGDVLGQGKVVQLKDLPKPGPPSVPPEADLETQLFETKGFQFMDKLDLKGADLNKNQKIKLEEIIRRNRDAFFNEDENIGLFNGGIEHSISIRKDMPFPKSRNYRVPIGNQPEVERQVKEMLKMDVIEPSISQFTSPIVLVRKKDGTFRFTTDFRLLNAVTVKQNYLIPHISDIVDLAAGAKFFTNLDLIQGFYQIPLREKDRQLTSFSTPVGTFQYKRMPMGLCGAPHTFQTAVRQLQQRTKAKLFCYLDDLLIVSNSIEQHMADIEEVLKNIAAIGFKIKIEKCEFAKAEVTFLGLLIGRDGVKPNPIKVKAIVEFPVPKTVTGVRAFIGMTNYFRRFIKKFAEVANPLYDLMKLDQSFDWKEEHQKSFEDLKKALCSSPVLQAPILGKPFIIESDASSIAVGALLLQEGYDKEKHPIAYASRKLTPTERKYPPIETEALGLVFAVKAFRTYILGSPITAIVDHRPLTSLMHRRDLVGRLAKYQITLQELDLTIIYRPGRLNSVCDALSRYISDEVKECRAKPTRKEKEEEEEVNAMESQEISIGQEEIKSLQRNSNWIVGILEGLEKSESKLVKRYEERDGIVYMKRKNNETVILMPNDKKIIERIMKQFHETAHLGAHLGTQKTEASIGRRFYWNNMSKDIKKFVKRCDACQRRKVNPHEETKEPMGRLEPLNKPWERLHADVCGPFPVTENGNRYILSLKDDFTK